MIIPGCWLVDIEGGDGIVDIVSGSELFFDMVDRVSLVGLADAGLRMGCKWLSQIGYFEVVAEGLLDAEIGFERLDQDPEAEMAVLKKRRQVVVQCHLEVALLLLIAMQCRYMEARWARLWVW